MPPLTPRTMRAPPNGRTADQCLTVAAREHAVRDAFLVRELLEGPRRELLLARLAHGARKLIEQPGVLGRDEHAEIFVGRALRDVGRGVHLHANLLEVGQENDKTGRNRGPTSWPKFFFQPLDDVPHVAFHVLQPFSAQALGVDDARHVGDCLIELVVQHHVLKHRYRSELAQRTDEPLLQRFGCLRLTATQPLQQHFARRRQHIDQHRFGKYGAELRRALHVDVHDDVPSLAQHTVHLFAQRAVQVAVHRRRLCELAVLLALEKLGGRQEIIVLTVHFVWARRSRRARHRVAHVRAPCEQRVRDRRLAAPRRCREDHRKDVHSMFSTCSAIRSSSSFTATTSCVMTASRALLPVVFASRSISCNKNPSRLPTWASVFPCNVDRNACRCERNRSTSSATSRRSARIAFSCANRCGSTSTPPASSCTDSRNRSRSDTSRSGARAAMRSSARSTMSMRSSSTISMRAPSASRIRVRAVTAS